MSKKKVLSIGERPLSPASGALYQTRFKRLAREEISKERQEKYAVIFSHAEFRFDWEARKFVILNDEELREFYEEEFPLSDYNKLVKDVLEEMNEMAGSCGDCGIYRPENYVESPLAHQDRYYVCSSLRNIYSHDVTEEYLEALINGILINEFMQNMCRHLQLPDESYQILPAKLSLSEVGVPIYLRDQYILINGKIAYSSPNIVGIEKRMDIEAGIADLRSEGFTEMLEIPFQIEGGNVVICENKNGKKIMMLAVSNLCYANPSKPSFQFFDDGRVRSYGYEEYCDKIRAWGDDLGYEVIIVNRNIEQYSVQELYHLDVFANVVSVTDAMGEKRNILVMPQEDCVTDQSKISLIEAFGEKNIIYVSERDRKKLASNFIQFGNSVIFSDPGISKELINEFVAKGLQVIIPPLGLNMNKDTRSDGIRCHTQMSPVLGAPMVDQTLVKSS